MVYKMADGFAIPPESVPVADYISVDSGLKDKEPRKHNQHKRKICHHILAKEYGAKNWNSFEQRNRYL